MSESSAIHPPAVHNLHAWFHRGVTERLSDIVGGHARLRVIVLLACVLGLEAADASTVGAVATELERSLRVNNIQVGLLVTASTFVGALATLPAGHSSTG